MKFRKQLRKRMINHVWFTFHLPRAIPTEGNISSIFLPKDGEPITIRFIQGEFPGRRIRITYYDDPNYVGYGGRIYIDDCEVSIIRKSVGYPFELAYTHLTPLVDHTYGFNRDDFNNLIDWATIIP